VSHSRRAQSSTLTPPVVVEVSLDVSNTTLVIPPGSTYEAAVRSELQRAFTQSPSLIDVLFLSATTAACAAQGISSSSCPNPPSAVLRVSPRVSSGGSISSTASEPDAAIVAGLGAALGIVLLAAGVFAALWWRERAAGDLSKVLRSSPSGFVIRDSSIPVVTNPLVQHNPMYAAAAAPGVGVGGSGARVPVGRRFAPVVPPPLGVGGAPHPSGVHVDLAGEHKQSHVRSVFAPSSAV
jgi:hypothetical protein